MPRPRTPVLPLLLSLVALLAPAALAAEFLRVYYPDIEQGSSTLVVSPSGRGLLVDGGTGLNPTDDDIVLFLEGLVEAGILTSLDHVLATHYDEDHIGRLEDVLHFGPVAPTVVTWDRGDFGGTPGTFAFFDYLDAAEAHDRTTITPTTDLDLGDGVVVECLVVNGMLRDGTAVDITGATSFENSASIGLVVRYGELDLWIGGDLTGDPTFGGNVDVESFVAPLAGDVDVYTVNHHGSRSSSNQTFLDALAAEIAINQNSVTNNFGHPNAEVVTRVNLTPDTAGGLPLFFQSNPGDPDDDRSDDTLAAGIADPDDVAEVAGLPGRVTLLSDGASYQVHGGALGAQVFLADTGSGPPADFPPAILTVSRSPLVPLAAESVGVEAEIVDEGAVTAELRTWLDGTEQPAIPMDPVAGTDLWRADVPAAADGVEVRLRVEATDSLGRVTISQPQAYYSGVTPIATFRTVDADGVLLPRGTAVRIEGHLTAEPGVFHTFVTQTYVDDGSGGVLVFDGDLLALARGDLVEFVGEVQQVSGQAEVNIAEPVGNFGHTFLDAGTPPDPLPVTVAEVDESLEGRLIRIDGVEVVEGEIPLSGNGTLTISDDGGLSTLTLFVDGDTDLPGAKTPTLPFDVIGIAAQFDTSFPFDSGYEIIPRGREDVLSEEVNLPPLLLNELFARPHSTFGDANGDGVVAFPEEQFVELLNTTFAPLDISGWSVVVDGVERHVFAAGTVVPGQEAVVVFGGGTPTGDFGNALVETASTGALFLHPLGATIEVLDDLGLPVESETYDEEARFYQSLVRDPDGTNTPFVRHRLATGSDGALFSPGTRTDGVAFSVAVGEVILAEAMVDPLGADDGLEWVELYNAGDRPIDLAAMSLGNGGSDYTTSVVQLSGTIQPGATFVVGGPLSTDDNANPVFDLEIDWSPDFQNGGAVADGIALFNLPAALVAATTVPVDAVVYGDANDNGLIDETGLANPPEVADAPSGLSIERIDLAGSWFIQVEPTPGSWPPPPPPPAVTGVLLSEVFYDAVGADDGLEWIELVNTNDFSVDLSGMSLGNGGTDYTSSLAQLAGTMPAGAVWVVGGPLSDPGNGDPVYDLVVDFDPDLQNSGAVADGVALFDVPAVLVEPDTVPVDAVVYGGSNDNGLIDETGVANPPEVGDASAGSSIERVDEAGAWQIQSAPNPNVAAFAPHSP